MYLAKAQNVIKKYEKDVITWAGLNQNDVISDNEFSSMSNASTQYYPLISPRPSRTASYTTTAGKALFAAPDHLAWVDGTSFYYNGVSKGTVTATAKCMVDMNGIIYIFPDKKYYDYVAGTFGTMQGYVDMTPTGFDSNGDVDYTTDTTKMRNKNIISVLPSTAYSLVNDKSYTDSMLFYYDVNMKFLSAVARSSIYDFTTPVDCYYLNFDITGTDMTIKVSITNAVYPTEGAIPDIDYATVRDNRIWAVHDDDIMACALGDGMNWTTFSSTTLSTDAFQVDTGTAGVFTGITTYKNNSYAFKKDQMFRLYGDNATDYGWQRISNIGCLDNKSIVEVNEYLYFLGTKGGYRYGSGIPELISYNLNETYTSGVAGGDNRYYYISLYNSSEYNLYVYDTWTKIWMMEDTSNITDYAFLNGYLYALASDNKIYVYNLGSETVTMTLYSKFFTEDTTRKKGHTQLDFRVDLESGTTLAVYVKYDNAASALVKTYTTNDYSTFHIPLLIKRCDHFQVQMVMVGRGKIYAMERTFYLGSKVGTTRAAPSS